MRSMRERVQCGATSTATRRMPGRRTSCGRAGRATCGAATCSAPWAWGDSTGSTTRRLTARNPLEQWLTAIAAMKGKRVDERGRSRGNNPCHSPGAATRSAAGHTRQKPPCPRNPECPKFRSHSLHRTRLQWPVHSGQPTCQMVTSGVLFPKGRPLSRTHKHGRWA